MKGTLNNKSITISAHRKIHILKANFPRFKMKSEYLPYSCRFKSFSDIINDAYCFHEYLMKNTVAPKLNETETKLLRCVLVNVITINRKKHLELSSGDIAERLDYYVLHDMSLDRLSLIRLAQKIERMTPLERVSLLVKMDKIIYNRGGKSDV